MVDLTLREVDLGVRQSPVFERTRRGSGGPPWSGPREPTLVPLAGALRGRAGTPAFCNDGSVGTPGWRGPPKRATRSSGFWDSLGAHCARLAPMDATQRDAWRSCGVSRPDEQLLASAKTQLSPHLPGYRWSEPLFDLGNELVGMEDGRARDPLYLSRAFLLQP